MATFVHFTVIINSRRISQYYLCIYQNLLTFQKRSIGFYFCQCNLHKKCDANRFNYLKYTIVDPSPPAFAGEYSK